MLSLKALSLCQQVLTLSMHKWGRGFFPGSGALHDVGVGAGRGFSLNLPLKAHRLVTEPVSPPVSPVRPQQATRTLGPNK
jgi:hypothetical protein